MPDDGDAPPDPAAPMPERPDDTPIGFWSELCAAARKELKPPVSGFFAASPNAPVQGVLAGGRLELRCANAFTAQMIERREVLEVVSRKAGVILGKPVQTVVVDLSAKPASNPRLAQLVDFGRAHSDIVTIKE